MFKIDIRAFASCLVLLLALGGPSLQAHADDVTDLLDQAKNQYEDGQLSAAKQSLEFASQLIAQQNASSLESFLPEPLDGWSTQDSNNASVSSTIYGGGISAEREYASGSNDARVSIVGDSPMISQMAMIFSNPMLMSAGGNQAVLINGNMAMVQNNELQMMVANRFLVTISGTASQEDKVEYAKAIDQDGLGQFGN